MERKLPLIASEEEIAGAIREVQARCRVQLLDPAAAARSVRELLDAAAVAALALRVPLATLDPKLVLWPAQLTLGEGTLIVVNYGQIHIRRGSTPTYIGRPGMVTITIREPPPERRSP